MATWTFSLDPRDRPRLAPRGHAAGLPLVARPGMAAVSDERRNDDLARVSHVRCGEAGLRIGACSLAL